MKEITLEQAVTSPEARKLADISQFMGKTKIEGSGHKIEIPPGARVIRQKSGEVKFFTAEPSPNNSHAKILPEGAIYIEYRAYREHGMRHIFYGEPTFYDERGNEIAYHKNP